MNETKNLTQTEINKLKELKGANSSAKRPKSKAKSMGLKSTFLFEDKMALTSFAKEKNTERHGSHLESMTNHTGDVVYSHEPILFRTQVTEDEINLKSFHDELTMENPAKSFVAQDYVGIKSALELKYFGSTFDRDNVHVQIAYNISDIKKILLLYVNQIIYVCYNLNRQKIAQEKDFDQDDIIGMLWFQNSLEAQRNFVSGIVDAKKRASEEKKLSAMESLLNNAPVYYSYFPELFKVPKKKEDGKKPSPEEYEQCKAYNYNIFRVISLIRQACTHEAQGPFDAEEFLYNLDYRLYKSPDLSKFLNEFCNKALSKTNKDFCKNSKNNIYILQKLYPNVPLGELIRSYYQHTIIKEGNNLGVNLRLIREMIIYRYMDKLKDKYYDTFRSKLYTVFGYVIYKHVEEHELLEPMLAELRANTSEENRLRIYDAYAQKFWQELCPILSRAVSIFEEEKQNKFKGALTVKEEDIACYVKKSEDLSCFPSL